MQWFILTRAHILPLSTPFNGVWVCAWLKLILLGASVQTFACVCVCAFLLLQKSAHSGHVILVVLACVDPAVAICPRQCPYWSGVYWFICLPQDGRARVAWNGTTRVSFSLILSLSSTAWSDLWPPASKHIDWLQSQHWASSHYPYWLFFTFHQFLFL